MSRQAVLERLRNHAPLIAPSMLKCDFGNLNREVALLEAAGAAVLHWDVMDGHFVPNLSYGSMVIKRLRDSTDLVFDAHLMISNPETYLDEYLNAGCDCVTFHYEATSDPAAMLERIRAADAVAGLAVNPNTPVDAIEPFMDHCDLILVMSVEPGFGGQKFIPSALDKLRRLSQALRPGTLLSVDGGIGPSTIGDTAEAGANLFVVGSAIFETSDYGDAVAELGQIVEKRTISSL